MKKNIISCIFVAIVTFVAGFFTSQIVINLNHKELIEANDFKRELIDAQYRALDQANKVMDNNELWDEDGSDDMMYYMDYMEVVDSLYESQL